MELRVIYQEDIVNPFRIIIHKGFPVKENANVKKKLVTKRLLLDSIFYGKSNVIKTSDLP